MVAIDVPMCILAVNFTSRHYLADSDARMVVPRLHVAGRKQGNLGRYLFFEIGKQRDERHLIK